MTKTRLFAIAISLSLAGMLMNSCGKGKDSASKPMVVAHRGASYIAPENTVASARKGWKLGAEAVEIDFHMSKNGRLMVIHDANTKRTTGVDMAVADTESSVLRTLDAGSHKGPEYAGKKIPFIEEILPLIPSGRKLFIEIKCGPEALPTLKRIIDESGKEPSIVIIGFGFDTVVESKRLMPDIPTYWLAGTAKDEATGEFIPHDPALVGKVKAAGLDGLDFHYAGIDSTFVAAAKAAGMEVHAWTVDNPEEFTRLTALGVDGITTNRPGWIREQTKGK